jgi:signal transduction histidine kinase
MALSGDLPSVLVDGAQFEAAMLNLVSNSRDAMPRGGTITVSTQAERIAPPGQLEDSNQPFVCVTVKDTGMGMSEETMRRASEPFFTTKEVGEGSGLGLSQVFGFAAQSGGFARISSHLGKGSTVQICLPAVEK